MLGKLSSNKTLIAVTITKDTYPSRGWTLVRGTGYSLRALLTSPQIQCLRRLARKPSGSSIPFLNNCQKLPCLAASH